MSELPKNRPSRLTSVRVNKIQFDHIFTDSAVAMGEKIARELAALKDDIAPVADKRFVLMKNKKVWFDRDVAGLFPRMEDNDLPKFICNAADDVRNYAGFKKDGFTFLPMTGVECSKTFRKDVGNPYLLSDGRLTYYKDVWSAYDIVTIEGRPGGCGCSWWRTNNHGWRGYCGGRGCDSAATLVPIYRLRGENAAAMSYFDAFFTWIELGLVPEGLKAKQEKFFSDLINDYSTVEDYITVDKTNETITFDSDRFSADVLSGAFTKTVFGYDFDIKKTLAGVLDGSKKYSGSVDALKTELLDCDLKRANIQPYEERVLTDVNRGHWDLFETAHSDNKDEVTVQLPQDEMLVARPPQMDVRLHGICSIDFGTKSTIVVCRDGDARMLRIGKGDYSKAPTMKDFENPTAIELRDINSFLDAYRARVGRPFTEWDQVTVSHQAAEAIFKANVGSSVYNSVFNELKQWAKDEQSYPILKDLSGVTQDIKPYLETQSIDGGDFDPIELYAYYLGLYINNMHHKIYLDYILSYPVNYRKDVREHIRASFERGLKKSLPPALQADEQMMKHFRVYLGASEPAAYAISALEYFDLEPKSIGEKIAYGVFDFGGGTTDFDFGIEYIPENRRRNFIIDQFGFNGDILLGGENILELLAYEVYKDNLDEMRAKKIPFALPPGCELFAGAEMLVSTTKDASSHMNNRIMAEKLRPIWEHTDEYSNFDESAVPFTLFSSERTEGSYTVGVNLDVNVERLEECIEGRIRIGVENFLQSMYSAFEGKEIYPIHIFLAGNSCRSPVVKKIFDEFIEKERRELQSKSDGNTVEQEQFVLHMPLGMDQSADQSEDQSTDQSAFDMAMDRRRTGKTGVAFGLLRCRKGGKDVKINNKNDASIDGDGGGNPIFQYYLGNAGADGKTFTVKIGRDIGYGDWMYFTGADEPDFEVYYTTIPRARLGKLPIEEVSMLHCVLDDEEVSDDDDVGIYIRKVDPNTIEYAVGTDEDFADEFEGKTHRQKLM